MFRRGFIIIILFYISALGIVPWCMMGELFAQGIKEKATPIIYLYNWTLSFILLKDFNFFTGLIGKNLLFFD